MAPVATDAKHQFSGRRGDGLTFKQFELMAKGSLLHQFTKLQRDMGNPVDGAMFKPPQGQVLHLPTYLPSVVICFTQVYISTS
jgi:hypothetical protein